MRGMHAAGVALLGALIGGCASGGNVAIEKHMTKTQAAISAAEAAGAGQPGRAALHLRLAREQLADAQKLIQAGEDERAAMLLERARADAELSLALAREQRAAAEARAAMDEAQALQQRIR